MTTSASQALDIQGHRGARGLVPENTLPAFARALSIGVTTLELDCGITRDGVVSVGHDPALNPDITRAPDGRWLAKQGSAIHALTFAELQRYDVGRIKPGSAYAQLFRRDAWTTRISRLADVSPWCVRRAMRPSASISKPRSIRLNRDSPPRRKISRVS
jgi:glycerophosphoryl diester phosphodiesterase